MSGKRLLERPHSLSSSSSLPRQTRNSRPHHPRRSAGLPRQPHSLRPHDRGDQLLLRRRPLRGNGPQPDTSTATGAASPTGFSSKTETPPPSMNLDKTTGPSKPSSSSLRLDVRKGRREEPGRRSQCRLLGFCPPPRHHLQRALSTPRPQSSRSRARHHQPRQRRHRQGHHEPPRVSAIGADWKQYAFTLKTGAIAALGPKNHLVLTVGHPGHPLAATCLPLPAHLPQSPTAIAST